ncbi:MAG: hypothetical protein KKE83_01985 [Proteobacteria bacterium]|nr:hypothetical protein [Pseudomonadota bacterium]MBU1545749.1 hypothetical protein [Pseudomonadota bacterium]MBU2618435.1 hypothetical protein [Pseudomonadota bacterium]
MKSKDYCRSAEIELTTWKAKLYDVIRKIDKLPTGDKEKMLGSVGDLNILVTELEDRIDQLRIACPADWKPEKDTLGAKIEGLGDKVDGIEKELFAYDFGG